MQSNVIAPCPGRHHVRQALACSHAPTCGVSRRYENYGRRINLLQSLSFTTDTSSLASLSSRGAPVGHDAWKSLDLALTRRTLLATAAVVIAASSQLGAPAARAQDGTPTAADSTSSNPSNPPATAPPPTSPQQPPLTTYSNGQQRYRLQVPEGWDVKGKAGADVLFEDPARRSTSVGITVNPVKIATLSEFGSLEDVAGKLLQAERRKESTLSVALVTATSRTGAAGATLYDIEYELDSTRGRKRILNTVTIFGSKLYILNAAFKCEKDGCDRDSAAPLQLLRSIAASFDVTTD